MAHCLHTVMALVGWVVWPGFQVSSLCIPLNLPVETKGSPPPRDMLTLPTRPMPDLLQVCLRPFRTGPYSTTASHRQAPQVKPTEMCRRNKEAQSSASSPPQLYLLLMIF